MSVSAEDREKAIETMIAAKRTATLAYLKERGLTISGSFERGFEAGWSARPGGASARPTREALAAVLEGRDLPLSYYGSALHDLPLAARLAVADALLAADHLWTEQPSDGPARMAQTPPSEYRPKGTRDCMAECPECSIEWAWGASVEFIEAEVAKHNAERHPPKPSAPVVDREALVRAIYEAEGRHSGFQHTTGFWLGAMDSIVASGAVVDRATVEAEQREKDAAAALAYKGRSGFDPGVGIAAAIRAGGA